MVSLPFSAALCTSVVAATFFIPARRESLRVFSYVGEHDSGHAPLYEDSTSTSLKDFAVNQTADARDAWFAHKVFQQSNSALLALGGEPVYSHKFGAPAESADACKCSGMRIERDVSTLFSGTKRTQWRVPCSAYSDLTRGIHSDTSRLMVLSKFEVPAHA